MDDSKWYLANEANGRLPTGNLIDYVFCACTDDVAGEVVNSK